MIARVQEPMNILAGSVVTAALATANPVVSHYNSLLLHSIIIIISFATCIKRVKNKLPKYNTIHHVMSKIGKLRRLQS